MRLLKHVTEHGVSDQWFVLNGYRWEKIPGPLCQLHLLPLGIAKITRKKTEAYFLERTAWIEDALQDLAVRLEELENKADK